jgi:hypothetical protein
MATGAATGDHAGMSQIRPDRPHNAVAPQHAAGGSADPRADVTDSADLALPERDEVEDSSVASFPASDPPSWWSGR